MNVDRIRDALHAQPFRPFVLRMIDGQNYEVTHPDFVSIPPARRPRDLLFFEVLEDGDRFRTHWLNVNLIGSCIITAEASK